MRYIYQHYLHNSWYLLQVENLKTGSITVPLPLTTYLPPHMVIHSATPRSPKRANETPVGIPADVIVRSTKIAVAQTTVPPSTTSTLLEGITPNILLAYGARVHLCLLYYSRNTMPEVTHPKQYMLHVTAGATYDPKDHQDVLINTEKPMHISSDLIDVKLHMRIKDYRGTFCATPNAYSTDIFQVYPPAHPRHRPTSRLPNTRTTATRYRSPSRPSKTSQATNSSSATTSSIRSATAYPRCLTKHSALSNGGLIPV
jgi:hypothetical protein